MNKLSGIALRAAAYAGDPRVKHLQEIAQIRNRIACVLNVDYDQTGALYDIACKKSVTSRSKASEYLERMYELALEGCTVEEIIIRMRGKDESNI